MQRKPILPILALLVFALPFSAIAFSDVSGTTHEAMAIKYVADRNIVSGYADGTYRPGNLINRAEFTKIIMNWLKKDSPGGTNCFPDVKGEWFSSYVCGAKKLSIIQGYVDGFFRPERNISLAEALKIVLEAKKTALAEVEAGTPWYQKYWNYALHKPSLFDAIVQEPQRQITRGEMASLVYNASLADFTDIISQFTPNIFPLEKKNFLTQNYLNLLQNFYAMASFGLEDIPEIVRHTALLGVWNIPDPAVMKLKETVGIGEGIALLYEKEESGYYAGACVVFKQENGWKIDWTRSALTTDLTKKDLVFAKLREICKNTPSPALSLQDTVLTTAKQDFSSEYSYEVYLNGYLIELGTLEAGVNTRGLPLKKGENELKIMVGKSYKDSISSNPSDPFAQMAKSINGLTYNLTVNEKSLVSSQISEPDQTVVKTFIFPGH